MIINCFRCGKGIPSPDNTDADYVVADDMISSEPRETMIAVKHNKATLAKERLGSPIKKGDYDRVEVPSIAAANKDFGEDLVRVEVTMVDTPIQKTGIICPDCFRPTDFVIWGVHKGDLTPS